MSQFDLPKILLGRNRQFVERRGHLLLIRSLGDYDTSNEMALPGASVPFSFSMVWRARRYCVSRVAIYWTRLANAASISAAAAAEASAGCALCCKSRLNLSASSIITGSVAGSWDVKSAGTLELLIRCDSGSRHLAVYGSPTKSSSERIAVSGLSSSDA